MYSWIEALIPPYRIGGEPEATFRLEALDGLHQADIALDTTSAIGRR